MRTMKNQWPLLLAALLASGCPESQTPGEAMVNYQWKILHSKEPGSNSDCAEYTCLNSGDVLIVKSGPNPQRGYPVTVAIDSNYDDHEYSFDGLICAYDKTNGSSRLSVSFEDTAADPKAPPVKLLTVQLVPKNNCRGELDKKFGTGLLTPEELDTACAKSPLIHWRVATTKALCMAESGELDPIRTMGDPSDGQGTGNGFGGG